MKPHYLTSLFCPNNIAVIGASDRPHTLGQTIFTNLLANSFKGKLYPVNLKHKIVGGIPAVTSVTKIATPIDMAILLTPVHTYPKIVRDCVKKGIKAIVLCKNLRGVAEEDEKYLLRAVKYAKQKGIRLLGPSALGLMRPVLGLNASSYSAVVRPGNLALISQSSALCAAMLDWADSKEIGFSTVVSVGDHSFDLDFGEILDFLVNDTSTRAILLHVHHVLAGRKFISALRAAARSKPVVVIKSGRSEDHVTGYTHASQLINSSDVFDSALSRAGVLRVQSISQIFTAVKVIVANYRTMGKRLAIISNGIGIGILAADSAYTQGVELPVLSAATMHALNDTLPTNWSHSNPIDLLADASPLRFRTATKLCLEDENVDGVLVLFTPQAGTDHLATAQMMVTLQRESSKPLFLSWLGDAKVKESRELFTKARCVHFRAPEYAVEVFRNLAAYHQNQQLLLQTPSPLEENREQPNIALARAIIKEARKSKRDIMPEHLSKALLQAFHVTTNPTELATSIEEALVLAEEVGYPVVLKINSADIFHKSDVGGVELNVTNQDNLIASYHAILERATKLSPHAHIDGISVQPMYKKRHARELMIGVGQDPVFGPVITFGLGGLAVEIQHDCALALPPLNDFIIQDMMTRVKVGKTLGAFKQMPPINYQSLKDILLRISELVSELPDIKELDINPLMVDENGAVVLDARIVLQKKSKQQIRRYSHMAIMPYPSYMQSYLKLKDKTQVTVRPIRPEDADMQQAFVRNLSDESRYNRYLSSIKQLSQNILVRFTQLDYDREMALVMIHEGKEQHEMLGVARYSTDPDFEVCEFALEVADHWQRRGVGPILMNKLFDAAREQGLKTMRGEVLSANTSMQKLMKNLGFTIKKDPEDPSLSLVEKPLVEVSSKAKAKEA